jgi:carbamoyltransferase
MKLKNILGISAGFHDAAATLIDSEGNILFAGHSERYSKQKNDANLCPSLLEEFSNYQIDTIAYYERPWLKQLRNLRSGQGVDWKNITMGQVLKNQLGSWSQPPPTAIKTFNHHLSHAAAGFQTSDFDKATCVVIDAIGEFDTVSIWAAEYNSQGHAVYRRLWRQVYPHSIGLFYSAATDSVGLTPMDEEYILMGMAAYGDRDVGRLMHQDLMADAWKIQFKNNLHTGLDQKYQSYISDVDLAAGAQDLVEDLIMNVMHRARGHGWSKNLVYMGGVALNCSANRRLGELFDNIWIMPCPGDAGSSLGAAALAYGSRIDWRDAFLGHNIPGAYPVNTILDYLVDPGIVGVASGRAEFGPRALGNRSLLADPRKPDIKDKVNAIKRRQQFRPFAPVILAEVVHDYFDMPAGWHHSPYMQSVARCRQPGLFPAVCHVDGSSRVQTVAQDGSGIRALLEKWYVMTGCPMLLNTSLNIRGEPMVNDRADADRFEALYGVKVCS